MSKHYLGKFMAAGVAATVLAGTASAAPLISEFQPNPGGTDPSPVDFELSGDAGTTFNGFVTFIDTDGGTTFGVVNESEAITGTFDSNGLLVAAISDPENPSFTVVLSSTGVAGGTDIDTDDDGLVDDVSAFGTIYDAIGIIDSTGDANGIAGQLGGVEFTTAIEFELVFRDSSTGQLFGFDEGFADGSTFFNGIFDVVGNEFVAADFTSDPTLITSGAINPSLIPEPTSLALLGLGGLAMLTRRRSQA